MCGSDEQPNDFILHLVSDQMAIYFYIGWEVVGKGSMQGSREGKRCGKVMVEWGEEE